jgi:predicted glycosyltransferase
VASVGHVECLGSLLGAADVVVASAGWGAVADAVAARARLALVPEPRPFEEQATRVAALAAAGLAVDVGTWPSPARLGTVLDDAMRLTPADWAPFYDGQGACRAAALIDRTHAT